MGRYVAERRTNVDFAQELRHFYGSVDTHESMVVLHTNNLSMRNRPCIWEAIDPKVARRMAKRIERHYVPEHASRLNKAEVALAVLARQSVAGRIPKATPLISGLEPGLQVCKAKTFTTN